MLEIIQTGQAGKTTLLIEMHRLRKRIFKDRLGWDVSVNTHGLEVDQFDIPEAVYLLALDDKHQAVGSWRLLPSSGPTMIRDVWPHFLKTIDMPSNPYVWEASRFGVDSNISNKKDLVRIQRATQELFCGLTELCILCGIDWIYTLYDERIKRILSRINCVPQALSTPQIIDGKSAEVGAFRTDASMLSRLHEATGINETLVTPHMLPPTLQFLRTNSYRQVLSNNSLGIREENYAA